MRFTQQEKYEIIRLVDGSDLSANRTLKELGLHKRTYYNWYARYLEDGYDGLAAKAKGRRQTWNKIPPHQKSEVVEQALEHPELSSRELAVHIVDHHQWYISESSVYRILKERGLITAPAHIVLSASDEFKDKTRRVNEMWQTDFTYFKIIGWGWYYLSTVLDDYSRYIITYDLCENMTSDDVKPSVLKALQVTGLTKNTAPRLLSDNGPCYISAEIKSFLTKQGIKPVNGRACHPQTQGKIERYHRTMKNVIKLENYYSPEELKRAIAEFVDYYNNHRYHESLNNLTPADVYYGRAENILQERARIKKETIKSRRKNYYQKNTIRKSIHFNA
jgi:transposase InsO family protein/transposase-like protein